MMTPEQTATDIPPITGQFGSYYYIILFRSIRQSILRVHSCRNEKFRHLAEMTVTILYFQQCERDFFAILEPFPPFAHTKVSEHR